MLKKYNEIYINLNYLTMIKLAGKEFPRIIDSLHQMWSKYDLETFLNTVANSNLKLEIFIKNEDIIVKYEYS
jgi:hypothetical protein